MNSLFNHAVKQLKQVKNELDRLEVAPSDAPLSLIGQISASLTSFQRTVDSYAVAAAKEVDPEKKRVADERLANFRGELQVARDRLKRLKAAQEDAIVSSNRQELFARRMQTGAGGELRDENPYSTAPMSDISREQGLAREGDVLARAGQQLDEFIERGRYALGDLTDQNELLRGTQRTFRKAAATLGVSQETIRKVEQRAREDKWIFYGGALTMFVLFYLIVRWLR